MGLYDDDNAAIQSGDQNNKDYFYAKAASEKVALALKTRQPEGAIKDLLPEAIKAYDEALKTYPNHADLKSWNEKAKATQGKVNPNAEWARFKGDFHWGEDVFTHGWVEYHWAKFAKTVSDWGTVYEQSRSAGNHLGDQGAQKHMKAWSAETQKWITDAKTEMDALWEESRSKR